MAWRADITWVKAKADGTDKLCKERFEDDDFMSLCQFVEDFGDAVLEVHITNLKKEVKCLQGVR